MGKNDFIPALFGVACVVLLAAAAVLGIAMRNASPVTAGSMYNAEAQTEKLMNAVCSGDYTAAEDLLSGSHKLALEREPSNPLYSVLWDAYTSNLDYQFQGSCYADYYGLYRDVTVTMPDILTLMEDLQKRSTLLLYSKAENSPQSVYDANGNYTQEFIMDTLAEEAYSMIADNHYTTTRTLTLHLTGSGGQWYIQPDPLLMDWICGGMGGA